MFEELIKKFLENRGEYSEDAIIEFRGLKRKFRNFGIPIAAALTLFSSLYTVPPESKAVVRRFGEYVRTTEPGLRLMFPFGIERVDKVPVKTIHKEEFGFRTLKPGVTSEYLGVVEIDQGKVSRDDLENLVRSAELKPVEDDKELQKQALGVLRSEYLMLTGDLNMADVELIVQYQISDPVSYLFNLEHPLQTLRDASQAVTRRVIGNGSIDEAITIGRIENEAMIQRELQKLLEDYQTGIHVVTAKLQSSNAPLRVRPSFNLVSESMQKKEQTINQAMEEYNKIIPKARGEAQRQIQTAEGYKIERINQAQGDVDKFSQVLSEYNQAPEITRQRLYFETMSRVLPTLDVTIIDDKGLESGFYRMFNLSGVKEK